MAEVVKLTPRQEEILTRMRLHSEPVRHTKMGYEINGRYLCDSKAMGELRKLNLVTSTYVDHPSGSRICVYSAKTPEGSDALQGQDSAEPNLRG